MLSVYARHGLVLLVFEQYAMMVQIYILKNVHVVTLILANVTGWSNSTSITLNTPANQGLSDTEIKCGKS